MTVDRRDFLRTGAFALAAAVLEACDSQGPKAALPLLKFAEQKNQVVEAGLFRHRSIDRASARAASAGHSFPSYFISEHVPMWDEKVRGPWSLEVSGAVKTPMKLSLDDLMKLPAIQQRVDHFCVEGWTAVAIWRGVRVSELARLAGITPDAGFVDFQSFDDGYHESWDLASAMHPQTLVAYAMDDHMLGPDHGAPARIHSPVKLGYKNTKYLTKIVFMPQQNGGYWSDEGYEWYGGT
jgi:DMSO/TMAO reductase YedYZ molybdopterin-dependent catalytic subunit